MRPVKNILLFNLVLLFGSAGFAQKQTFDVISFSVPKGWQQQQNDAAIQLSVGDKQSGVYAMAIITKASASTASASENFNNQWTAAIKNSVQLDSELVMQPPSNGNGWDIVTGGAGYTDKGGKGNVALLTATGGGQTVSVVIMTNTKKYESDLAVLLNSLELSKPSQSGDAKQEKDTIPGNITGSPLAGKIWEGGSSEKFIGAGATTGYYTGGFSIGQYRFNADGTYRFISVIASYYTDTKTLEYETGTYSVSGNQLTINPVKGKKEEWSKIGKTSNANGDVTNRAINETWGSKLKTTPGKLEKYTYTFSIGKNGNNNTLVLHRNGRTEREGEGQVSYYNETSPENSVKLPTGIK